MSAISAADIKKLRESTGAGMLDCKKALEETKGNYDEAVDWLRKKGLAAAAKKASRAAAEGLIAIAVEGNKAAIIELNAETDFVSKNPDFQTMANQCAEYALQTGGDINALKAFNCPKAGKPVEQVISELVGSIGENLNLRRSALLEVSNGAIASYIHNAINNTLGRIGVLVALESSADAGKLQELGKQIAMHIAAARPEALTIEDLPKEAVEKERNVLIEQSRASGKPENIIEKMVEGRIRKFYEEVVLLEQLFVIDGKTKVKEVITQAEKELGTPVKLTGYVRFQLGEGVEKEEADFAQEVAAAAGGR